jgi:hypothetical protein
MGVRAGVSDFILISPEGGKAHALELKAKGKKPTQTQKDFMCDVVRAGGEADWADNFDDAMEILRRWNAVKVAA